MYHGIINIYKEAGYTSHDVVAVLRGILNQKKVGHMGTLDPDAVGVLPVGLGVGTRLNDMLSGGGKEYVAELYLGVTTDTQDMSGDILTRHEVTQNIEQIKEAVYSFKGDYEQIPPMYSAIKVNGKKLYELARKGQEVERKARCVQIDEIEIMEIQIPVVKIRVVCSAGTYIRTLCDDIGKILGCGAAMKSLQRTRVGSFLIDNALTLDAVKGLVHNGGLENNIIPVDAMFLNLRAISVDDAYFKQLQNGNRLTLEMIHESGSFEDDERARIYSGQGVFFGIYRYEHSTGTFSPVKMFIT
ncbi:MAG: tRNA pseudouridine(55) synthase TruB [Lachnospiraceae bacterium]|nr:tRNA pseudouridine(55) synthase TruB [Lachnospiraceae bacterium]